MISLIQIPCQHEGCTDVALSQPAYCYGCDKVLCQEHLDASKHHDCREIEVGIDPHGHQEPLMSR